MKRNVKKSDFIRKSDFFVVILVLSQGDLHHFGHLVQALLDLDGDVRHHLFDDGFVLFRLQRLVEAGLHFGTDLLQAG